MTSAGDAEPLTPIYPFGEVGADIRLYQGPMTAIGGGDLGTGEVVVISDGGDLRFRWTAAGGYALGDTVVQLDHGAYGRTRLPVHVTNSDGRGCIDQADLGDRTAALERVVVHWLNLPWILRGSLTDGRTSGAGRWSAEGAGWRMALDSRPDLGKRLREQFDSPLFVMSHVGELRRADGSTFTTDEATDALHAWHVAFSFALGRWVPPLLPVGYGAAGRRVWEHWSPWRCDVTGGFLGWWDTYQTDDLTDITQRFIEAWARPDEQDVVRHVAHHLVCANHPGTTTEARLMLVHAGLEYLSWAAYVLSGARSGTQHRKLTAEERLRELLSAAGIPADIPNDLRALRHLPASAPGDGPAALMWLRNRLVHPKDANEPYRVKHAIGEAWRLSMQYGDLLLLHTLGFQGRYVPRWPPGRFAHDHERVPWAAPGPCT